MSTAQHTPLNPHAFPNQTCDEENVGMTLRDYFAAHALPPAIDYRARNLIGRLKSLFLRQYPGALIIPDKAAEAAYKVADAMLAERQKASQP